MAIVKALKTFGSSKYFPIVVTLVLVVICGLLCTVWQPEALSPYYKQPDCPEQADVVPFGDGYYKYLGKAMDIIPSNYLNLLPQTLKLLYENPSEGIEMAVEFKPHHHPIALLPIVFWVCVALALYYMMISYHVMHLVAKDVKDVVKDAKDLLIK